MVNRALTSPPLWCGRACGGRSAARSIVSMVTAAAACFRHRLPKAEGRSPFVRLHELLADIKPGKPAINLSVGEPQHAIPPFVGPVLAAHLNDFGRYPANKGTDGFRRAAAAWLGRRYKLPRPLDPETEIIVLNGTREGLFLGAIAAKRYVGKRAGKPAILIPNPFYAAYSAGAAAADCEPVYLPTTRETGFLPDLDAIGEDAAGAHRRVLPRLAVQPAGRGRRCRLSHAARCAGAALRLPGVRRRMLLRDLSERPPAARHAGSVAGPTSPTSWCSIRCRSAPTCRACASALPPATAASSPAMSSCATSRRRRCRCRCRRSPSRPMPTRRMSKRTASSMSPSSISPTRSSATATATSARPAASSCGSM